MSLTAIALNELVLDSALAAMRPSRDLIGYTPDVNPDAFKTVARIERMNSPYNLPAVDALVAGTIGAGLHDHADRIEDAASQRLDMAAMLGDDFRLPSFVQVMEDMGNVSTPGMPATYAMNANLLTQGAALSA